MNNKQNKDINGKMSRHISKVGAIRDLKPLRRMVLPRGEYKGFNIFALS